MNRIFNTVTGMTGGRKTGKRRTRKLVAAGLALACVGMASPTFADFGSDMSGITLKLGGSGLYNSGLSARQAIVGLREAGAHISADFHMSDSPIAISPFLNIYHRVQTDASSTRPRNDVATNMLGGVNLLIAGARSDRTTLYFGAGGGIARLKTVSVVNVPLPVTGYKTRMMADALVGVEVKLVPKISFFLEPHYVWASKMLNGLSAHVGLGFDLSKAQVAPQRHPVVPLPVYTPKPAPKALEPLKKVEEVKPRVSSAEALATMQEMIYFRHDKSDLSDKAKAALSDKVAVFRANPTMRIVIVGFASQPGTAEYNMALGLRRAEAAKAYLVSQGVDQTRIEIATHGEGDLAVEGPGKAANMANRRDQFRLLIVDQFLEGPMQ
jgi:peptidoglycan-associated lipoprotein